MGHAHELPQQSRLHHLMCPDVGTGTARNAARQDGGSNSVSRQVKQCMQRIGFNGTGQIHLGRLGRGVNDCAQAVLPGGQRQTQLRQSAKGDARRQ